MCDRCNRLCFFGQAVDRIVLQVKDATTENLEMDHNLPSDLAICDAVGPFITSCTQGGWFFKHLAIWAATYLLSTMAVFKL